MKIKLKLIILTAVIPGVILLATNTYAEEATLSIAKAQQLAVERSRQLVAQDSTVNANREMAVVAGQLPDPVLRLGIDNLPTDGADKFSISRDFMTMRRIGISQEFTRSEKRQLRSQLYQGEMDKTLAEKSATIVAIQRSTALAWVDRYYAEAIAAVVAEQISAVKLEIVAAENAYRSNRGSQADVFAAHLALANLEDRMSEANQRVHTAITNLARWVGDGADKPLADKPDFEAIHLDTGSLDDTLAHHPRIAVLTQQEKIAETEAQLAQANKKADWSFEVSYAQRGSDFSNMLSAGISVPLQWNQNNRQNRELASKLATIEQIKAEREEMLREHISEISALTAEWKNNRERLSRYQRDILPLSIERTRATVTAYRAGKASLSDLLLARRNEIDTRQQSIQLEMETAKLWAQLNFLMPENATITKSTMNMHQGNEKGIQ